MTDEQKTKSRLEIAHVLFMDIVGYSKLLTNEQSEALHELNRIVRDTEVAREAQGAGQLTILPTGDGMALVFTGSVEEPAECALEISQALRAQPSLPVRMGIHSGPVHRVRDANDRENIAGVGINIAQRVMDCGDAGHILVTKRVADDLAQHRRWQPYLHELGDVEVKHGTVISLVNLYAETIGNPAQPGRMGGKPRDIMRKRTGGKGLSPLARAIFIIVGLVIALTFALAIASVIFTPAIVRSLDGNRAAPPPPASPSPPSSRSIGDEIQNAITQKIRNKLQEKLPPKGGSPTKPSPPAEPSPPASPIPEKSIAVLPFDNFSEDKENEHFADGVHDDVLTSLAKIEDLKVISRTSVMQYRRKAHNIRAIAQELGVSTVVEGSVRRAGNRVRLVVQLIDAPHDRHLWGQEYDRDLTDVFAIQSALAQEIAVQLKAKLSAKEVSRIQARPTTNEEAYELYLQAHGMYTHAEETLDTLQRAEQLYQKATQLDPSFALAFARLAHIESWIYYLFDPTKERLNMAAKAAAEAMRLQPNLAESHLATGYVAYYGARDYDRALTEFETARRGLPNDAGVFLAIASIKRRQGKWKESITGFEKAASLSPGDPNIIENLALTYEAVRDFPAAAKGFDRAVALVPNSFEAKSLRARVEMEWKGDLGMMKSLLASLPPDFESFGMVALARFNVHFFERKFQDALNVLWRSPLENLHGQTSTPLPKSFLAAQVYRLIPDPQRARAEYEHALSIAQRALQESPQDSARHSLVGLIYAGLGRKEEAIREGNRALELLPESSDAMDGPVLVIAMARIYAIIGDAVKAIDLLQHSLHTPAGLTMHEIRMDPSWDEVRTHPRFHAVRE